MSRTLLVYDDDPDILDLLSAVAEEAGFETVTTQTDDEFWQQYGEHEPAAILLDLMVPGASGIEMLGELAIRKCTAPIMFMSGYHEDILNSARRLGGTYGLDVRDVIMKPFNIDDLKAKLEAIE